MLEARLEHPGPVVLDKTQPIVIVENPLCVRLHLSVFDLTGLLLDSGEIKSVKEADLQKDASEKREVMVVTETDHPSQDVVLALLIFMIKKLCHVELFRDGDEGLDYARRFRVPVWPIQIERHHFGELRRIFNFHKTDVFGLMPLALATFI